MKIAVWAWAIDHPGAGMEIIAMDVCSELQKNYEVRLYSQIRNPQYAKPQTTFPIYFLGKNKFRYLSFRSIQAGFRFRKEVIKYHPDVIIFVSPLLYPFLRQFLFGRKLKRIKHIVWEHSNYNSQNKRESVPASYDIRWHHSHTCSKFSYFEEAFVPKIYIVRQSHVKLCPSEPPYTVYKPRQACPRYS